MTGLDISPQNLEIEKRVVIEEYKQRYLNQPYGDMQMPLRALAYRVHPYRWATIGLAPEHIAEGFAGGGARLLPPLLPPLERHSLSISADIDEERMIALAEKWFSAIEDTPRPGRSDSAGTSSDRAPAAGGRTQRSGHDDYAGLSHGQPPLR